MEVFNAVLVNLARYVIGCRSQSSREFLVNDFGRKVSASYLSMNASIRERQEGATAAEYALLVALISVVIIGTVTALGAQISIAFDKVRVAIEGANEQA